MRTKAEYLADDRARLLSLLGGKNPKVYTVLRSVSRSGMQRAIDLYVIKGNIPLRITWAAANVAGYRYDKKKEALIANGCGMDMGFAVVYNLSIALFCAENYNHDKAYKLKQEWM